MINDKLGKIITHLRKEKGLTQKELAEKLNKAESTIGLWEQSRRELDYESLILMANFFNVSIDYLLGNTKVRNIENQNTSNIQYALYDEVKDLSQEQQQDILDMVKKMSNIMKK